MGIDNVMAPNTGLPEDQKAAGEETNTQTTEAESEKSPQGDSPNLDGASARTNVQGNEAPIEEPKSPALPPHMYQPGFQIGMTPTFYHVYGPNSQITPPEPPSPAPTGSFGGYGPGSFPPQAPPMSPGGTGMNVGIPPSPLFPRTAANVGDPPLIGVSPQLGPMAYTGIAVPSSIGESNASWPDSNGMPHPSPHLLPHALDPSYAGRASAGSRSSSFEEIVLPAAQASAEGYGPSYTAPVSPRLSSTTVYQSNVWPGPYGSGSDLYTHSPAQPSRAMPMPPPHGYPQGMPFAAGRPMGYGSPNGMPYYPAASPGPPIQTGNTNKGPDGANLFIFHIPNHFTNADMFNLFCRYGNLISVRIMVEKETGRSRGFGFVSYDSPEAAAMAIKELNGFTIGNKRLKVQHKQIRAGERGGGGGGGGGGHGHFGPPSAPTLTDFPPPNAAMNSGNGRAHHPNLGLASTPWMDAATRQPEQGTIAEEPSLGALVQGSMEPLRTALPDIPRATTPNRGPAEQQTV